LAESPKHFAALREVMPGISQKVLTQQLRELVSDGIVYRQPQGAIPAPVEYSLTDYGRSLLPLVEDVRRWGRTHMERLTAQTDTPVSDP
jgi:DNA-binding HxlR family transcriptional regulator